MTILMRPVLLIVVLFICSLAWAENQYDPTAQPLGGAYTVPYEQYDVYAAQQKKDERAFDFEHEDAYIDILDALKSRKFVQRVIVKEAIADSSHFELGRFYLNHLMGFSAVHQNDSVGSQWIEYGTAVQGIAGGYALKSGHALEAGVNLSTISELHIGYRYFLRLDRWAVWPFAGVGAGVEVAFLRLADGPFEVDNYTGKSNMFYFGGGLLMPLLDVGLKMEGRLTLYGSDRFLITTGIGVILFL